MLQNKKYIKFADQNTVEVMSLGSLDTGIQRGDKRAATYTKNVNGKDVEFLVEFPNLTVEDIEGMRKTKAGSYNDTGKIPFTALIDPHTEKEMWRYSGGMSAGMLQDQVKAARKTLKKAHGSGISRKSLNDLAEAEEAVQAELQRGEYSKAIGELSKVEKASSDWPQTMQARVARARQSVVAAAEKALKEIDEMGIEDPTGATKQLSRMRSKLRGTGLEDRAAELLTELKGE